jgi:hypothetical protein
MAIISLLFDPSLDPALIMNKLYVETPLLGVTLGDSNYYNDTRVFSDDIVNLVFAYSKRIA